MQMWNFMEKFVKKWDTYQFNRTWSYSSLFINRWFARLEFSQRPGPIVQRCSRCSSVYVTKWKRIDASADSPSRRFSFTIGQLFHLPAEIREKPRWNIIPLRDIYTVTRMAYMNDQTVHELCTTSASIPRPRLLQYVSHYPCARVQGGTRTTEHVFA